MKFNQFRLINFTDRDNNIVRLIVILILVFALMTTFRPNLFPTLDNFTSMAYQFPEFGVLSIAMMFSLLVGGVDLSIVGIANLSVILAAKMLIKYVPYDAPVGYTLLMIVTAILLALTIGALCGALNGFIISKFGIPDILATLGSMQLFTGLAIVITRGRIVVGIPYLYSELGNAAIWGIIPVPLIIFIICVVAVAILLDRTSFGLKLYMMGTNSTASRFSGINNTMLTIRTYMCSGILSAVAGLIILARTNTAKADFGSSYILQTVLIGVLGGVNPSGGFGTVGGVTIAVLILQFLSSGFNMFPSVSNLIKDLIWGGTLILVMVFNYYINKALS